MSGTTLTLQILLLTNMETRLTNQWMNQTLLRV